DRRTLLLRWGGAWAAAAGGAVARAADADPPWPVVLATPGPGSAVSAIPELAQRLGADREAGLALRLKFTGGGGIAIREILSGNAQCGVFGITAAMHENLRGPQLVALAAVENRAPLSLMVRPELKGRVRSVADLTGRVLGVHSNSMTTTTNGQQFMVALLRQHGLTMDAVRVVAAGQSWDTQSAALRSGLVDAVISEEPFGLRMEQAGLAFALVRLGLPAQPLGLTGEGFLRGALMATRALVSSHPELAQRLVQMVQRTLAWRRSHSVEELVLKLGLTGAEAQAFGAMLHRYPQQFSADGRFSAAQMAQTDAFFQDSSAGQPDAARLRVADMLVDTWAGRAP
ncbi:MAG: hypothetical protein CFE45_07910, partial [Burkholderiales bacterium PBB5]